MKSRFLISSVVGGVIIFGGLIFYSQNVNSLKSKLTVQSIDNKGIFIGESSKNHIDFTTYDHKKAIKAIDDASDFESAGNGYYRNGDFMKAVEEYKKAYLVKGGLSQATSGLKLAMAYEKLGRYNEGIVLLDQMIQNGELSKNGVKNANVIKSRLLAASATKASADPRQTAGGLASSGGKKGLDE